MFQSLARVHPLPQLLLTFLELPPGLANTVALGGGQESNSGVQSYTTPVLGYDQDPYLAESEDSNDSDNMITQGMPI